MLCGLKSSHQMTCYAWKETQGFECQAKPTRHHIWTLQLWMCVALSLPLDNIQ